MSDLTERLRSWHNPGETVTGDVRLYLDAADEIERLRAALKPFAEIADWWDEAKEYDRNIIFSGRLYAQSNASSHSCCVNLEEFIEARRALEQKP